MRLELNLPALERLIGGDTEIELALRKQIAESFAEKHLKKMTAEIITTELHKRLRAEFEAALKVEVDAKLNEYVQELKVEAKSPYTQTRAGWTFKEPIEHACQKAVDAAVVGIIKYQKSYWGREISKAVDAAILKEIEKVVEQKIRERLEAAAKIITEPKA